MVADASGVVRVVFQTSDEDDDWLPSVCEPGEWVGEEYRNREADVPSVLWDRWLAANAEWSAAREALIEAAGVGVEMPVCDRSEFDGRWLAPSFRVSYPSSATAPGEWPAHSDVTVMHVVGEGRVRDARLEFDAMPERFVLQVSGRLAWIGKADCVIEELPERPLLLVQCERCGHLDSDHPNFAGVGS